MARKPKQKRPQPKGAGTFYTQRTKSGILYYCWKIRIAGVPVVRKSRSEAALIEKVRAVNSDIHLTGKLKQISKVPSLEQKLSRWMTNVVDVNLSPNTAKSYRSHIKNHIVPSIGSERSDRIGLEELQTLVADIKRKRKGAGVVTTCVSIVCTCLGLNLQAFVSEGLIMPKKGLARDRIYEQDEIDRIMREMFKQDEAGEFVYPERFLFTFILNVGTRISEALGLPTVKLTLRQGKESVTIDSQILWEKGGVWSIVGTKGHNRRDIALNNDAVFAVKSQLALTETWREACKGGFEDTGLLFVSPTGLPYRPGYVWKRLQEILTNAGVGHGTIHDMRRTLITALSGAGVSDTLNAQLAGHSSEATTKKHYSHAKRIELMRPGLTQVQLTSVSHHDGHHESDSMALSG